mmetsp:Transcript_4120/g.12053  ORF Transcript_4120/g.12053 Transcript_4120/m.12053 type:complete len:271 (-) Transcript_4120:48-860(-)
MLSVEELVFGEVLGTGGFGAVYRGTYRGQEVAVKRLHPAEGAMTPAQLEEFQKEVTNLSLLSHPRLIHLVGAAFQPPSLCIVTEFMPNGSLYSLLHTRRQQLASPQKLAMSMQVTEGVGFLHSRSPPFVHRDLKSLNVVLDFSLNAKLCDFGLAQSMEKTHITRRENECGSPRYMAPELFDSRGKITEKVDIWSLGCLVLEVHLGKLPHAECTSLPQVMDKTLLRRELPFSARGEVGEELWTLAELCLEFCPQRRVDVACLLEGLRGLAP